MLADETQESDLRTSRDIQVMCGSEAHPVVPFGSLRVSRQSRGVCNHSWDAVWPHFASVCVPGRVINSAQTSGLAHHGESAVLDLLDLVLLNIALRAMPGA